MKAVLTSVQVAVIVMAGVAAGEAQVRKMSDGELDRITAGSAADSRVTLPAQATETPQEIQFKSSAGSRHTVEGTGTVQLLDQPTTTTTNNSAVVIRDNAQQNLRSLINLTAVNSRVQVLVNLNISINSTVGTVNQLNGSGGP